MKKDFFILILILILSLFLRSFRLSSSPPRLTHDEMSIGYNAYSILKTGRDEWGRSFPLDFEAFGDHKLPGYIYALVPILSFLPLSASVIKIPSIFAGLLTILAVYLLTKDLTKNKTQALLSALLVAISPWPIHLSRMALESNLALASFSWGIYFLIKSFSEKNKKNIWPILSGIFLGLTTYFYVAYRLIVVLVLFSAVILNFVYKLDKKKLSFLIIFFVIIVLPLTNQFLGQSGTARFTQVSIFSDEGAASTILEQQNFCFLSQPRFLPKICRVIYNKPFLYIKTFSKNYLSFLLPTFLFLEGDQLEYLNNPGFGEFFMFLTPFYLIGIYDWFKEKDFKTNLLKITFLITPIPSALVGEPQIVRGSALLIFVTLFTATGIFKSFKLLKKKSLKYFFGVIISFLTIFSLLRFFISYTYIYPGKYESAFYHLPNEIIPFLKDKEDSYDTIYIDKIYPDAHIMIAFYNQIDPNWYQDEILRPTVSDDFGFSHPTKLGKYEFGGLLINDLICDPAYTKTLFITNHQKTISQWLFKDFSNVHVQAQVYDIDLIRENLKKEKIFDKNCENFKN